MNIDSIDALILQDLTMAINGMAAFNSSANAVPAGTAQPRTNLLTKEAVGWEPFMYTGFADFALGTAALQIRGILGPAAPASLTNASLAPFYVGKISISGFVDGGFVAQSATPSPQVFVGVDATVRTPIGAEAVFSWLSNLDVSHTFTDLTNELYYAQLKVPSFAPTQTIAAQLITATCSDADFASGPSSGNLRLIVSFAGVRVRWK